MSFPFSRTLGAGTHNIATTDSNILCDTSEGVVNLVLPKIYQVLNNIQRQGYSVGAVGVFPLYITDISGDAATNNINIVPSSGDYYSNNIPSVAININNGSVSLKPVSDNNWNVLFSKSTDANSGIQSVTFAQLTNLISTNSLTAGVYYLITNFQTIYDQPDFTSLGAKPSVSTLTGATEPLIVFAATNNSLANQVISTLYPRDYILYDVSFTSTEIMSAPAKGRITERITYDTNNRADYDIRNVLFKRYESSPSSGIFDVIIDNGGASSNLPTFNSTNCYNNYIGNFKTDVYNPFLLSNNVLGEDCYNNNIGNQSYNNTMVQRFYENEISVNFYNNIINPTSAFRYNNIAQNFNNNYIEVFNFTGNNISDSFENNNFDNSQFASNNISNQFANNTISTISFVRNRLEGTFTNNVINGNFNANIVGGLFDDNTINNDCQNNIFGNGNNGNTLTSFSNNQVGNSFTDNTIQSGSGNKIGNSFSNNIIGIGFNKNKIENVFNDNTISNNFQYNYVNAEISFIDFTTATHVYQTYTCTISEGSTGTNYLQYINGTPAIVLVSPTA